MTQLQKYTWLLETIRRAGKISHKELSDRWERNKDLSDCKPLNHSQRKIADCDGYADFELIVATTYDFVMKLLQVGALVEVIYPDSLRATMRGWINNIYKLYNVEG